MSRRHSNYLVIAIGLFTLAFFTLNSANLIRVLKTAFINPFAGQSGLPESPVIRISLQHNANTYAESFIKNSVTTRTGKSAYFLHIPDSVDLASSTLSLQDKVIQLTTNEIDHEKFEDDKHVIYFVREGSPQRMMDIITSQSLLITQPPQP